MNKKIIIVTLIVFLISQAIIPQVNSKKEDNSLLEEFDRLITFETTTNITIDEDTLPKGFLTPGKTYNGKDAINAKLEFKFERPWYFPEFLINTKIGKWILFRDTDFDMSVNISLSESSPDWIDVDIPKNIKVENINSLFSEKEFSFNFTVNQTAEALIKDKIKIQASFEPEENWGLASSKNSKTFEIESAYVPKLEAEFIGIANKSKIEFKAGQIKQLPLKIKNLGNGETIVQISSESFNKKSKNWNISVQKENITFAINEEKIINITVKVKDIESGFKNQFDIKLIPRSSKNQTQIGESLSLKSPNIIKKIDNDYTEMLTYALLAIIIIVIIALVFFIFFRKKLIQ